jgi:hypothetical protein
MVFPLLDVVPDKLVGHPNSMLPRECGVLTCRVIMYGKSLSALAAHNGFHQDAVVDGGCPAQTSGYVEPQEIRSCSALLSERLPV